MLFYEDFFTDFDKDFYKFKSLQDMNPYRVKNEQDHTTIIQKAVGINEKDMKVDISTDRGISYLSIKGETKDPITGELYQISSRFSVDADDIKNIVWKLENGICYIHLYYKEPTKRKIPITQSGK